jgi:hypothetical protein
MKQMQQSAMKNLGMFIGRSEPPDEAEKGREFRSIRLIDRG